MRLCPPTRLLLPLPNHTTTQVARTHTFGRVGTHGEEGFDNHLSKMQLNTQVRKKSDRQTEKKWQQKKE